MAEPQKPKDESVLTDKDKFKENPDKEKVGHMGDKPGQAQEQQSPKK